ncbi:MAG: hypothetical protein ACTSRA_18760 [Promethearchaeota archaeon]
MLALEQIESYQGNELGKTDCKVMLDLERLIGKPIPPVSKVEINKFGFVAKDNYIIQLGLYKKG